MISKVLQTIPEAALKQASVRRDNTALLVIDMQNYFYSIAETIRKNLIETIDACRKSNMLIIFTQHGYDNPEIDSGMLGQWWKDPIVVGTDNWRLFPEIVPKVNEKVIHKRRYSAFYGTDLELLLKSHGVEDIIIGGVMTNLCCETTARDAFVRDYRIFFLVDGTATVSEEYQIASLKNLAYGFAYLKQCDDIIEELNNPMT